MTTRDTSTENPRRSHAGTFHILGLLIAGLLCWVLASPASADTLVPAAETGGSDTAPTASEMLRGAYSPIRGEDVSPIVSTTDAVANTTVSDAEALRGELSPIRGEDASPIVSTTDAVANTTVSDAEALRGELSPIA